MSCCIFSPTEELVKDLLETIKEVYQEKNKRKYETK